MTLLIFEVYKSVLRAASETTDATGNGDKVLATQRCCYNNRSWYHKFAITYTQESSAYFVLFALWHIPSLPVYHSYRALQ